MGSGAFGARSALPLHTGGHSGGAQTGRWRPWPFSLHARRLLLSAGSSAGTAACKHQQREGCQKDDGAP
jgi:hypothetical protein